ncbi:YceI family protein [Reichenbachiella agarivorans]|uniref:YceI family protein n=1 Tax=Reichenbachiella agarivorans TaxID=2979464 RepID=A0ABY6CPY9_9BACT|nr:YceI family protein [Reichenbachiella agarivorans]UXP32591.1 YceI family protein [Reichenbachiella agarivorans]
MKIILTSLLVFALTIDQWQFKADPAKSTLVVQGTSSVHDWESVAEVFSVTGTMNDTEVTNLDVSVSVKSIKSGKSIMDDKTYEALKADKHPKIYFKAETLKVVNGHVKGDGTLTIAGKSKRITIDAASQSTTGGYKISGVVTLKMSEYGVTPPTAMFGTMQTGDQVTIQYQFLLIK